MKYIITMFENPIFKGNSFALKYWEWKRRWMMNIDKTKFAVGCNYWNDGYIGDYYIILFSLVYVWNFPWYKIKNKGLFC